MNNFLIVVPAKIPDPKQKSLAELEFMTFKEQEECYANLDTRNYVNSFIEIGMTDPFAD